MKEINAKRLHSVGFYSFELQGLFVFLHLYLFLKVFWEKEFFGLLPMLGTITLTGKEKDYVEYKQLHVDKYGLF